MSNFKKKDYDPKTDPSNQSYNLRLSRSFVNWPAYLGTPREDLDTSGSVSIDLREAYLEYTARSRTNHYRR